jgi:hypothetical protein
MPRPLASLPTVFRLISRKRLLIGTIVLAWSLAGAPHAAAQVVIDEGFDSVAGLIGWTIKNNSVPLGSTTWVQGADLVFTAYDGAAGAYIAANYNNTGNVGTISDWLITPQIDFGRAAVLTFWTRKISPDTYADRLQVRVCQAEPCDPGTGATATSVGSFNTMLVEVNPTQVLGVYPQVWTQYTITRAQGLPKNGRAAWPSATTSPAAASPEPRPTTSGSIA